MNQLLVCISYEAQHKVIKALLESIAVSECREIDMRLSSIGANHQVITLILAGSWHQLTRFKTRLSIMQERYAITSMIREIKPCPYASDTLPYEAYITMPANPKALHRAICFFLSLPFIIHRLSIITYEAPVTHTRMLEVTLLFITPFSTSVNDYRENILQFCDENNFEVVLEAKRT